MGCFSKDPSFMNEHQLSDLLHDGGLNTMFEFDCFEKRLKELRVPSNSNLYHSFVNEKEWFCTERGDKLL